MAVSSENGSGSACFIRGAEYLHQLNYYKFFGELCTTQTKKPSYSPYIESCIVQDLKISESKRCDTEETIGLDAGEKLLAFPKT